MEDLKMINITEEEYKEMKLFDYDDELKEQEEKLVENNGK